MLLVELLALDLDISGLMEDLMDLVYIPTEPLIRF